MNLRAILKERKTVLDFVLILGIAFLVYGNAIHGGFISEDFDFISNNQYVKNWRYLPQIFSQEVGAGSGSRYTYYRPLHIFSYLIEYSLWGLNVVGYHLTSIFLHGLVGFLIYKLTRILFNNRILSLATALLFIAHPVHNSAVAHIAGRENLLGAFFLLLSFIMYLHILKQANGWSCGLLFMMYVFALLTKENNIMLPALLLMYHFVFRKSLKSKPALAVVIPLGLYFILRALILKAVPLKSMTAISVWQRIPSVFVALFNYLGLCLCPVNIHEFYENPVFPFYHPKVVAGFVLAVFFLFYAWRKRHDAVIFSFSILWFFIFFLPVSNIYPLNAYMGEHRIYLASVGYFLIAAKVFNNVYQNPKWRKLIAGVFLFLLANYALLTYQSNYYWRNYDVYVEENFRQNPDNPITLNAWGCLKYRRNENDQAVSLLTRAIKKNPGYIDAYINLGVVLREQGKGKEAKSVLEQAIRIGRPPKAAAYHNLAAVYTDMKQYSEAERLFLKAVEIFPYEKRSYYGLGTISLAQGDIEKAIRHFHKVLELDSQESDSCLQLCRNYYKIGQRDLAVGYCDKYIDLISANVPAQKVEKIKRELNDRMRKDGGIYSEKTPRLK